MIGRQMVKVISIMTNQQKFSVNSVTITVSWKFVSTVQFRLGLTVCISEILLWHKNEETFITGPPTHSVGEDRLVTVASEHDHICSTSWK